MWRQQRRDHFDKGRRGFGGQDRREFRDQNQRRDDRAGRERSTEKFRQDYDSFDRNFGDDRLYNEQEADAVYADEGIRREERYWDDGREGVRYREDNGRGGDEGRLRDNLDRDREDFFDHREVRDTRDGEFQIVAHSDGFEEERAFYRDDRDDYRDEQSAFSRDRHRWEDDRMQTREWDDYRRDEQPYRDDRAEFRNDERDNFRDQDRLGYRDEEKVSFRTDRDRNRQFTDLNADRYDRRKDNQNRPGYSERQGFKGTTSRNSRDRNNQTTNTNRGGAGKLKPGRTFPQNRPGLGPEKTNNRQGSALVRTNRYNNYNRGKVAAGRNVVPRTGRQEQSRQKDIADKHIPADTRHSGFVTPKGRSAGQKSDFLKSSSKGSDVKSGKNTERQDSTSRGSQCDETKTSSKKTESVSSHHKKSSTSRTQHSSRSDLKVKTETKTEVKRDTRHSHSEPEKQKSRDLDSSSRHGSSHQLDSKSEARKIYGSFHEEDAISILADDDGFTRETHKYLGADKSSGGKVKTESDTRTRSKVSDAASDKHVNRRRNESTGRYSDKETGRSRSKENYRDKARYSSNEMRAKGSKVSVTIRKPFGKYGISRFSNRNESVASRNRKFASKHISEKEKGRLQSSPKGKDSSLVRIGRTGAILKDDRFGDNLEKDHSGEGNRSNFKNAKEKNEVERFKSRGIKNYNKVKRKYLSFGRRGNSGYNKNTRAAEKEFDDDRDEHFSKFRNERDEGDFEKRRALDEEIQNPDDFGPNESNQQVIFIPNPDFQENPVPVLDQYGNTVINPDLLPGSFQQQVPVQFIPSNLSADAPPPGTEYVFIPFVNDAPGGISDNAVNVNENKEGFKDYPMMESNVDSNTLNLPSQKSSDQKKAKPLTKAQRSIIRLRLMKQRRQRMEKRVEQRILQKLMQKTENMEKGKAGKVTGGKAKPTIKRISPPSAGTSAGQTKGQRQRRQELDDVSADEYENVSDLEDITDDENGERTDYYTRAGERRQAFRKPGEPRLAIRNKGGAGNVGARQRDNDDAWQASDVRKVVERNTDSRKRAKDSMSESQATGSKKLRVGKDFQRNRSRTPIKITVNNDQFVYISDDEEEDQNTAVRRQKKRSGSQEWRSESRNGNNENRRHSKERERRGSSPPGKYERKYRDERDRYSDRKDSPPSPHRHSDSRRRGGKYSDDEYEKRSRKSRFSDTEDRSSREANRQGQTQNMDLNSGQDMRNNMNSNVMPSNFMNNQSQSNFSPFGQQQQMSQARNQFNPSQSLPFGFQQAGFNQSGFPVGNSDPSLPPVSHGSINMSPFGQPNMSVHPDMSLPPTVGPVAGTASSMVLPQNNFPQQNMQSSMPMQQSMFSSGIQNQSMAQQGQQVQQMNPSLLGVQGNPAMNQQNIPGSMQGSRPGFQASNSPLYQQSQQRIGSQGGNIQQQNMMGPIMASSNQNQGSMTNPMQNQQSGRIMVNAPFVSGQQNFVANQSKSKDSFTAGTLNDAMKSFKNMRPGMSLGANPNRRHLGLRHDKAQAYRGRRGAGVLAVPRSSIQAAGVAVRNKAGNQGVDNRIGGKGANDLFISQPGTSYSGDDIDEEIGELLCIKCDKVFLSESMMRRHNKWHILVEADVNELRCDTCQQGFTSSIAFNVHMREKHTGTILKCEKCNTTFTNSSALARHIRTAMH